MCVYATRARVWPGARASAQREHVQLSDEGINMPGVPHRAAAVPGPGQTPEVEDLLQLLELVEADIAVQAERVRAVRASALRFCDPGKGDNEGRDWDRGAEKEDSKS